MTGAQPGVEPGRCLGDQRLESRESGEVLGIGCKHLAAANLELPHQGCRARTTGPSAAAQDDQVAERKLAVDPRRGDRRLKPILRGDGIGVRESAEAMVTFSTRLVVDMPQPRMQAGRVMLD